MAESLSYCPVVGKMKRCSDCPRFDCMDFFLYVICDAENENQIKFIQDTLQKMLINQIKTTIIIDSFDSKILTPVLKDRYDYIIAENFQGKRYQTALTILLRQKRRGILVFGDVVTPEILGKEIARVSNESNEKKHFITEKIKIKFAKYLYV